jgi:riboflavin synthase
VIEVPAGLEKYIARKGSLCVNGVSLTVNDVNGREVGLNIIPHTLEATNFCQLAPGSRVNVEVDIIARYLERLLRGGGCAD